MQTRRKTETVRKPLARLLGYISVSDLIGKLPVVGHFPLWVSTRSSPFLCDSKGFGVWYSHMVSPLAHLPEAASP